MKRQIPRTAKNSDASKLRSAAPRVRLDRAAVIRAAAELADEQGTIANLQLVELAQRLGIRAPSLYAHVENLDDLRRGIALLGLNEIRERVNAAASGHSGVDALRSVAREIRNFALERPGRYIAAALPPSDREWQDVLLSVKGVFLTIFSRYGISGKEATECVRVIRASIHGFILLEAQGDFGQPNPAASFERLVSVVLKGLLNDVPEAFIVRPLRTNRKRSVSGRSSTKA